jgi:hypothetical protein
MGAVTYIPARNRPRFGFEGDVTPEIRALAIKLCEDMQERELAYTRETGKEHPVLYFGTTCDKFGVECGAHDGPAHLARAALWSTPPDDAGFFSWPEAIRKLQNGWIP